jgi:hypothetical protein
MPNPAASDGLTFGDSGRRIAFPNNLRLQPAEQSTNDLIGQLAGFEFEWEQIEVCHGAE